MSIRAVIIDGDGTAFLSEERNRRAIEKVAAVGGFWIDSKFWDLPSGDAGAGDERIWHMIVDEPFNFLEFKSTYPDTDSFQDAVDNAYLDDMDALQVNLPVLSLITECLERGIYVAGASNARTNVFQKNLEHTGFPVQDFSAIVGKDMVLERGMEIKPAPDPFLFALELLNNDIAGKGVPPVLPSECLGVEDSCTGAQASVLAGFETIHLSHESGALPKKHILDDQRYYYIDPRELGRIEFDSSCTGHSMSAQSLKLLI